MAQNIIASKFNYNSGGVYNNIIVSKFDYNSREELPPIIISSSIVSPKRDASYLTFKVTATDDYSGISKIKYLVKVIRNSVVIEDTFKITLLNNPLLITDYPYDYTLLNSLKSFDTIEWQITVYDDYGNSVSSTPQSASVSPIAVNSLVTSQYNYNSWENIAPVLVNASADIRIGAEVIKFQAYATDDLSGLKKLIYKVKVTRSDIVIENSTKEQLIANYPLEYVASYDYAVVKLQSNDIIDWSVQAVDRYDMVSNIISGTKILFIGLVSSIIASQYNYNSYEISLPVIYEPFLLNGGGEPIQVGDTLVRLGAKQIYDVGPAGLDYISYKLEIDGREYFYENTTPNPDGYYNYVFYTFTVTEIGYGTTLKGTIVAKDKNGNKKESIVTYATKYLTCSITSSSFNYNSIDTAPVISNVDYSDINGEGISIGDNRLILQSTITDNIQITLVKYNCRLNNEWTQTLQWTYGGTLIGTFTLPREIYYEDTVYFTIDAWDDINKHTQWSQSFYFPTPPPVPDILPPVYESIVCTNLIGAAVTNNDTQVRVWANVYDTANLLWVKFSIGINDNTCPIFLTLQNPSKGVLNALFSGLTLNVNDIIYFKVEAEDVFANYSSSSVYNIIVKKFQFISRGLSSLNRKWGAFTKL